MAIKFRDVSGAERAVQPHLTGNICFPFTGRKTAVNILDIMGGQYYIVSNLDKVCCIAALWAGDSACRFSGRDVYFTHIIEFNW